MFIFYIKSYIRVGWMDNLLHRSSILIRNLINYNSIANMPLRVFLSWVYVLFLRQMFLWLGCCYFLLLSFKSIIWEFSFLLLRVVQCFILKFFATLSKIANTLNQWFPEWSFISTSRFTIANVKIEDSWDENQTKHCHY